MIEQIDKQYVLQTYARNYVNFKKGITVALEKFSYEVEVIDLALFHSF
jgi:hypothetical protein